MADHKSAIKRNRQNIKRRERNKNVRTTAKSSAHNALAAFASGDKTKAKEALAHAVSVLASTARKGAIPQERASRKISRLYKAFQKALGSSASATK